MPSDPITLADLWRYEYCDGPGPHNSEDDSCSGGCGGYGFWSTGVSEAEVVQVLEGMGAKRIEAIFHFAIEEADDVPDYEPGAYLVLRLES